MNEGKIPGYEAPAEKNIKELLEHTVDTKVSYEMSTIEKEGVDNGAVEAFSSESWECVDGRYDEGGTLRYPGGSAGLLLTLASAFKSLGLEFDILNLKEEFEKIMGRVRFHSDTHAHGELDEKISCAGCGHIKLAYSDPEKYLLDTNWIENLFPEDSRADVILKGEHKEQVVVILTGDEETKLPASRYADGTSFFVYHQAVAQKVLENLALEISKRMGFGLNPADLIEAVREKQNQHLSNTVQVLAKDLPVIQMG